MMAGKRHSQSAGSHGLELPGTNRSVLSVRTVRAREGNVQPIEHGGQRPLYGPQPDTAFADVME